MNIEIKKDLASNWFKTLQDAFCDNVCKLERNKYQFKSKTWRRNLKKDEGEVSIEYYKMEKFLKKLE